MASFARQEKLDKKKKKYPPAKALPLFDREDSRKAEQRRLSEIVKKARGK